MWNKNVYCLSHIRKLTITWKSSTRRKLSITWRNFKRPPRNNCIIRIMFENMTSPPLQFTQYSLLLAAIALSCAMCFAKFLFLIQWNFIRRFVSRLELLWLQMIVYYVLWNEVINRENFVTSHLRLGTQNKNIHCLITYFSRLHNLKLKLIKTTRSGPTGWD